MICFRPVTYTPNLHQKPKKSMKSNVNMVNVIALAALLAACQTRNSEPVEKPVVERQDITVMEIEPDDQLYKALEDFTRNEYSKCATEIRKAAQSVRIIASSAGKKQKGAMENTAESLEGLATRVEKSEVKDLTPLNKTFAKTGRVLAGYRLRVSETEYFTHSEQNSGKVLANTINQLEQSVSSHHRDLTAEEKQVLDDALEVAERLQKRDKVDEDDFKSAIQSIDNEIEKWDKEFEHQ
jgi:hypothetical protein